LITSSFAAEGLVGLVSAVGAIHRPEPTTF
jgi:hypothetical protein